MSLLSGNVSLKDLNIKPEKVNEIFEKANSPFALKAGLISKLDINFSLLNIFSNALQITVEDILFIIGPNISHLSLEEDFETNLQNYDEKDPIKNIVRMTTKVYKKRKLKEAEEKEKKDKEKEEDEKKKNDDKK